MIFNVGPFSAFYGLTPDCLGMVAGFSGVGPRLIGIWSILVR
jgi:hypothetical protein